LIEIDRNLLLNQLISINFASNASKFLSISEFNMKIQPCADNILIESIKSEEKTKSGILLPASAEKERPEQGKVIAVGPGKKNKKGDIIPVSIKVGQKVLFSKYGPNEIKVDGKEYLIAKEDDVLAIIEEA